ncbi:sugar phosphate isomerase/epimerase family protein [Metabacillus sediminilitoris]|uniref:Sugar phosphate isomerase/epimerase n=1 Tax=Metabacillus sediminilitoris TaxID=2567941 RepID=A0A4S4BTX4_9BACI|nr:sugar phosphate isomerase/epimerase family protein [Metabacillus sediminilitoris]QGQ44894.1 TIM barrel protein [Metabacillus sediminilitoris]THF78527.1 sugar phosphate isomerase/epimerase [Metabacillus sediminilitoris]
MIQEQNYKLKDLKIREAFLKLKREQPERFKQKLNLSWSNWGFGLETLEDSVKRLKENGINFIELHGNHYGNDLGYQVEETIEILKKYEMKVSGVCGMFSVENDLSSNIPSKRQAAIDYIKRELEFMNKVGGHYLLVVPGAVGRPNEYDDAEFLRSVETLNIVSDLFVKYCIKGAIEPIRAAETSFIHTVADAKNYIKAVGHPGINHINADVYHMQSEEAHIGEAILEAGDQLVNLHMADSNRGALGEGFMDFDTIIMALYLIGFNQDGKFVTPEPLGPGGDPYPAMNSIPDSKKLHHLVAQTANYFRERENILLESNE